MDVSEDDGVRLLVFYGSSPQEAADRMKRFLNFISVGPDKKLKNLGEEAYLWTSSNGGFAAIRFRKANVFIDLSAPSAAMAKDLAKSLAKLIPKK